MSKTLGQIAFEALPPIGGWRSKWEELIEVDRVRWGKVASAVTAAVKEEDAKLCEDERVEEVGEVDQAYNWATEHCAAAIRARIDRAKVRDE